jgi:thiol:disulfide interchange protein
MRLSLLLLAAASVAGAQSKTADPVAWTAVSDGSAIQLTAKIESPWHLYSMSTPRPPIATSAKIDGLDDIEIWQSPPVRQMDENFGVETETFDGEAVFYLKGAIPADAVVNVRYQVCTDKLCLPPKRKTVAIERGAVVAMPSSFVRVGAPDAPGSGSQPAPSATPDQGMARFLLIAFGFGLAAIFTPCVFPMIPITMSFFLGQSEGRSRGQQIFQAALFCLGIIFLFTLLGATLTALLGPFGVVQIASNPWVNGFIAAIFIALALSMFGAFEITLPSGLLTKLNAASGTGGAVGTLLMGLTFSLTAFACVGPFVGTLLAASVAGDRLQPMLGMMAFATGLALPFFFLAMFPSVLKSMPRSGGWLARVKVVMGFVILAAALKYLSNVDQVLQWNFLTRERFLAAWFVMFLLPGLYLLGQLPMEGVKRDEPLGIGRLLTGSAFVIFAVSLLPGMFGGRLGELDAFVPLPAEGQFATASGGERQAWLKNDLPAALAKARSEGKLVFVNFTGYACTNCHWMKANMFPRPEIRQAMNRFVLLELYTDGTDAASEANQKYQEEKFANAAIPYYAILDPDEKVVASFPGLTKNPAEYLAFLDSPAGGAQSSAVRIGGEFVEFPGVRGVPFGQTAVLQPAQ